MSSAPDLARFCVDWVRSMDRITNYTSLIGDLTPLWGPDEFPVPKSPSAPRTSAMRRGRRVQ